MRLDAATRHSRTWTVTLAGRPRTLNAERAGHWRTHRRDTATERDAWGWLWRQTLGAAKLGRLRIDAYPHLSGPQQDPGNCYPSVKAAIDALVDIGAIPDDGPGDIASITLHAPQRTKPGQDRLTILVTETT